VELLLFGVRSSQPARIAARARELDSYTRGRTDGFSFFPGLRSRPRRASRIGSVIRKGKKRKKEKKRKERGSNSISVAFADIPRKITEKLGKDLDVDHTPFSRDFPRGSREIFAR